MREVQIEQGTRQGCPLSSILFILSFEILNNVIRDDIWIKALTNQGEELKELYACTYKHMQMTLFL